MSEVIKNIDKKQMRQDIPQILIGDTVKVFVKVVEGTRERLQAYEGTVIANQGGSISETITVRRVSYGVGIERVFPIHSPRIDHIEVIKHGKVRRAKLFFLRERSGKSARLKEKK